MFIPSLLLLACFSSSTPSASATPPSCKPEGPPANAPLNVLGTPLTICSTAPMTGWFRDGTC
ncbi:MAG: DUF2237 family protein, partial [Myxococcota bacterium]